MELQSAQPQSAEGHVCPIAPSVHYGQPMREYVVTKVVSPETMDRVIAVGVAVKLMGGNPTPPVLQILVWVS